MTDAAQLLNESAAVLLDFDGPVTPLMPAPANMHAADAARQALAAHGATPPDDIAATSDHLAVIRWTGTHVSEALADVENACTAAETNSARICTPTPGARALLAALHDAGTPVVIVSNNAAEPIRVYLERHGLTAYVRDVVGRPYLRPDLMKPEPHTVHRALTIAEASARSAVFIGDSVSDIEVARATGVRSIGYAKTVQRGTELRDAGADAVIDHMARLAAYPAE
ncbi:phosphoglycolate phosphatase [Promicromonospora umidemergens]|uniref:HAD family hydrolase n=1 Tax=Promicromonospora umidemergens TaxID=629679 RepID=A0ABP8WM26_9MICO|nr:HAD family hydrolase [Promicromonospora umidemergens]MCP2286843.1 phosphoglycolate phosphatase [Promicromonospora umidemergens]